MKSSKRQTLFSSRKNGLAAGAGPRPVGAKYANRAGAQELRVVVEHDPVFGR